jgi:hypothetical protein
MQDKFKDKMMIHSGADSVRIIFYAGAESVEERQLIDEGLERLQACSCLPAIS